MDGLSECLGLFVLRSFHQTSFVVKTDQIGVVVYQHVVALVHGRHAP
jgi:hypothetical protein